MTSSRISPRALRTSLINSAILIWLNYEVYRVGQGTHPYISPRLEAAGYIGRAKRAENAQASSTANADTNVEAKSIEAKPTEVRSRRTEEKNEKESEGEMGWISLHGIPMPSFEKLYRPFRRD